MSPVRKTISMLIMNSIMAVVIGTDTHLRKFAQGLTTKNAGKQNIHYKYVQDAEFLNNCFFLYSGYKRVIYVRAGFFSTKMFAFGIERYCIYLFQI